MGKARVTRTIAVGKMSDPEPGGDKGDDDDSCGRMEHIRLHLMLMMHVVKSSEAAN